MKFSGDSNPVLCHTAIKHNSDFQTTLAKDELAIEIAKGLNIGEKQLTGKHSCSVSLGKYIIENGLFYI